MRFHTTKLISANDLSDILALMKKTTVASDLKRLQCIYFRALGYAIEKISALIQLSIRYIRRIWTHYFKVGIDALITKPRGGRRRYLLDEAEEKKLLAQHAQAGSEGSIVEIDALHQSLCKRVGKPVALSTTYRMAHRHGWRKIAPRPFHVLRNSTQAEYFKIFFSSGGRSQEKSQKTK